jgi:hypothetical protein
MKRTQFYTIQTITPSGATSTVRELDYLWNSLSNFSLSYEPGYYRVKSIDLMRPDLISYKVYGTVQFWWIILLINNIENPFTGLVVGQILTIPNKLDIYEYQKTYRLR